MWELSDGHRDGRDPATSYENVVLFTVHGVYSDNAGLERLSNACKQRLPGLRVFNCSYYQQHPLVIRDTEARKLIFSKVRADLMSVRDWLRRQGHGHDDIRIVVVAHSLGTLAFHEYLTQPIMDLQFDSLVLVGSILPRDVNWSYWVGNGRIRRGVLNVTRPFDHVVGLGKHYVKQRTLSGSRGFIANGDIGLSARNTFKHGGHTDYYPSDVDDVVGILQGQAPEIIDEDGYLRGLSKARRFRLRLMRALGVC